MQIWKFSFQPEIVPPTHDKRKKKHRNRKTSSSHDVTNNKEADTSSSTTEIGCEDSDVEDVEELPKDANAASTTTSPQVPHICIEASNGTISPEFSHLTNKKSGNQLQTSRSSNEINAKPLDDEPSALAETKSESDLLKFTSTTSTDPQGCHDQVHDAKFMKELIEEFDKHPTISDDTGNDENLDHELFGETNTETLLEDENDDLHFQTNDSRALEIIKENSEILEKLLNKKTTPCHPELLANPNRKSNGNSNNSNGANGVQHQQSSSVTSSVPAYGASTMIKTPMTANNPKRRSVSQTSSNGSSHGSSKTSSNITLQSSPATKPITFNPFPSRTNRKPKEVGKKLGLYK